MKNTRKNRTIVTEFIWSINYNCTVQFEEDEFYCEIDNNLINVTFNPLPEGDRLYREFIEENFGISVSPFLMGILHELGHIYTYDKEVDQERDVLYYMLQVNFKEEEYESYTKMYFSIPAEYEATKWGVEFYLLNKDYCDNFLKEIGYEA